MKRTVTEPATAARLLLAAGALDLLVVLLMIKMVLPFLAGRLPLLPPEVEPLFIGVVVLLAYWLVTDVVCGGWSVGRACLMIEPRHKDGTRPGMFRRLWRLLRKTLTLGLAGLRMDRLSGYDQASGYQWLSTFGTGAALRAIDGGITVISGGSTGKFLRFEDFPEQDGIRVLRVGRSPGRSGFVLSDPGISACHATFAFRKNELKIYDGQPGGQPSTNGIFVFGKRLKPQQWHGLGQADEVSLGPVTVRLDG
jgi:hypothetical protein